MTRKWIMRALCILCLAAMLTGCGREPEVTETTIEVKKNGQVVHTIIEDFSESYYNLDVWKVRFSRHAILIMLRLEKKRLC